MSALTSVSLLSGPSGVLCKPMGYYSIRFVAISPQHLQIVLFIKNSVILMKVAHLSCPVRVTSSHRFYLLLGLRSFSNIIQTILQKCLYLQFVLLCGSKIWYNFQLLLLYLLIVYFVFFHHFPLEYRNWVNFSG